MPLQPIFICALGGALLIPYIFLRCKGRLLTGLFIKAAISSLFMATAAASLFFGSAERSLLHIGILLGLLFGLFGDIFLDQKDIYPQHKEPYMFAGFISFAVGHIFYLAGLYAAYGLTWGLLPATGIAALIGVGSIFASKPMRLEFGRFKAIVGAYGALLTFMVAACFAYYLKTKSPQAFMMGIGGVLFFLSDLVLSGTYFGEGKTRPIDYALNYLLYYGAQFTIALSIALD
ncbi:MAG: lysoplasmalogenase [Oscillospiraceae bacterium]|jgi:uncharacterized membrane protein YhhN|nr:lysoplasmalogenase [Oscillospiraceae bacterium]